MTTVRVFDSFKEGLLSIDPVAFCEKNLTLDGQPFRLNGNGYKPFSDIYRYIGIKALEPNAKPVILVKGRQVGATTMAAALECFFMGSGSFGSAGRPPIRVMHCFPQLELCYAYSKTKLHPMLSSSRLVEDPDRPFVKPKAYMETKSDKSANDSLHFKQFENGNHIWVESVGVDGNRVRGRTVDVQFHDEVQDMRGTAIANAIKCLNQAKYGKVTQGVQVYFGTPKQRNSEYFKMWQKSSQQYYHLGCEKCEKHFPLYTPGSDEWERIWLYEFIVRCTHCGHEQDKRDAAERGRWVAANDEETSDLVGYHINQLYMPMFSKEDIIKQKPDNHPINTERAWQNEVLGEFFAGDASPITPDEIETLCADKGRKFRARVSPSEGKKVYLGCDWGQKVDIPEGVGDKGRRQQGQSYSCVVVLVAEGPKLLSIDFATRLKRNDPEHKKQIIEEMYRRYAVNLGVGDIGYANDLTWDLQQEYGEAFLASEAHGTKVNGHVKYNKDIFPYKIVFERDYYIGELYDFMKNGHIRFPWGDYEKVAWLVEHCCSMEIKPRIDRGGFVKLSYVKGTTPNDGFMALLNAYLAYKFDITDGFKIDNPQMMNDDPNKRRPIPAIVGYCPNLNPLKRR